MLEEKDLQAITQLMKDMEDRLDAKMDAGFSEARQELRQELAEARQELRQELAETRQELQQELAETRQELRQELAGAKQDIMRSVSVLMEQEFRPQFNLLAENQQIILEKLAPLDDLEVLETRVSALEAMVKKINRELAQLKKVQ